MNKRVYDITNLLGLVLITVCTARIYGIDSGLAIGGALLIVLNIITLKLSRS